jgi:D-galactose 1-dehydrogenase
VFDPGINALSILTNVLPAPVHIKSAELQFPANKFTPIAASVQFSGDLTMELDWLKEGRQMWEMTLRAGGDVVALLDGGNRCMINDLEVAGTTLGEYPALYHHMATLVREGRSDVDLAPMVHVSDAMTLGKRINVAPFSF